MAITLRIIGFHNCDGCSRKVRIALHRIGVELVGFDPGTGSVTISTSEHPEVIRYALERQLKKSVVILSRYLVTAYQNPNPNPIVSHQIPSHRALDLQEIGQVVFRLAHDQLHPRVTPPVVMPERGGYISVQIRDVDVEYAPPRSPPWAATEPTAPLMPMAEQTVYGYPPDYYGISTTRKHDDSNGCCTIL
ncbi:hypothetical protein L1987_25011 [Smallanthus sonchifolius]|uniref:Uncharacterized protein n=1 Tax=Smallanthus sonchifolius TaxID=185202 RepID=A0ACB9IM81_9ASTR|nr:hypothetical protein L1987_25011 [Smallanthus sonchifolius]